MKQGFKQSNYYKQQKVKKLSKRPRMLRGLTQLLGRLRTLLRHPICCVLLVLCFSILLLPTLFVTIFSGGSTEAQVEKEITTNGSAYQDLEADPLVTVSVMREQTKEIEEVPLETYVLRVVASEMPNDFELEALKAQSLTARTYIVNHLLHSEEINEKEVTDTVEHQVYQDDEQLRRLWGDSYEKNMKKMKQAVSETAGEIVTYEEEPITPTFFSTSNGYTENSEDYWGNAFPYLRSVASPWDKTSPKYHDQVTIDLITLNEKLGIQLPRGQQVPISLSRTESNRVKEVTLNDDTFSGKELREQLHLSSNDFSIEQKDDYFVFTTRGYGHGVGMSQYGANGMAKEGKSYKEIIQYYYQDVQIQSIEDTVPTLVMR